MTHRDPATSTETTINGPGATRGAARGAPQARDSRASASPRFGAVLHAFYPELAADIVRRLETLVAPPGLIVSTVSHAHPEVKRILGASSLQHEIVVVENHGRDIWPFFQVLTRCDELGYELVLKLHTKRSRHRDDGGDWRSELLDALLGSEVVDAVRTAFETDPELGLVGPSRHHLSLTSYVGANEEKVIALGRRLGVESIDGNAAFFAGSMFYVRLAALAPLRAIELGPSDFEPELGQVDGTLAHAIERCFPLAVESAGFTVRGIDGVDQIDTRPTPIRRGYAFAEQTRISR